jgi:hypothetical protein
MARVQDLAGTKLTIDGTSKAARTLLYDCAGRSVVLKATSGSFLTSILIRQSAASVANTLVWSLFNPDNSGVVARIRAIRLMMLFDGTSPGAQGRNVLVYRTGGLSAPTAGTALTPTKKRTADAASVCDVRFLDTGLTTSLTKMGDPFGRFNLPMDTTGKFVLAEWPYETGLRRLTSPMELREMEGIGIYLGDTAVIGQGLCGYVEWDETTS